MKVLFVGIGSIAIRHIDAIKKINNKTKIYALRRSESKLNLLGIINIYNLSQVPSDISFSIISNPTSEHANTIRQLIQLNKPIFIEKPVLADLRNAQELLTLIEHSKIITYVACNLRFHPAIKYLKEEFKIRKPLEYTSYCGSYLPNWRPEQDYRENYSAIKDLGGGVHLDLIHEIDLCVYLLGYPINKTTYFSRKSKLEIDTNDIAHYIFEFENTSAFITLNYYRSDNKRSIECVWENETWYIDLLINKITNSKSETIFQGKYDISDTYYEQMIYFLSSIKNQKQPNSSYKTGIEVLKLCIDD